MKNPISIDKRYYIVDDFYTDPDAIRNFAITQPKEPKSNGNYAGVMTENSFVTKEHLEEISKLVGHGVIQSTDLCGKFRFTKESDTFKQYIHFDPGENLQWAGIVYLTPDINTEGTSFWKHKRTGLESIPLTQEGIEVYGWNSVKDLKHFLETDGMDESCWEKTLTIPYKYNRLVLFRPWLFHSPGPSFGDDIYNSRLVQTFFFSGVNIDFLNKL